MAARFRVVGTTNDWSDTTGWSLTSGGAGGQAVPLATDDVTLDGNSGSACVLNTSARVAKTLVINGYTGSLTFDQQLSVSGSITFTTTGFTFAGATTNKLRMIAAGTWTTNGKTITQDVEVGGTTTFIPTLAGALTTSGALTLTNTTSTPFSGNFLITAASCTISGTQTVTNSGHVQINGLTTASDATSINGAGKEWRTFGLTTTGTLIGSSLLVFNGTGTWTGAAGSLGMASITINTAGTLTISGTVITNGSGAVTLTYIAGTVVTTGSTLSYGATGDVLTLDTTGMTWNNIIWNNASAGLTVSSALNCASITPIATVTLNALLTATTLTMPNAACTLAGTSGFTVGTFTNVSLTATRIWTFKAGVTYTVTTAMDTQHAAAQTVRFSFVSSTPGTRYNFILGAGATQDNGFIDATDANSSAGQTVFTYHGVLSNTLNWATAFLVNAGTQAPAYMVGI